MATPPQGWKQGQKSNIYEANISQINIPSGTVSIVAETDKTTGSYTVYSTDGINFLGGRTAIYTVSASGAVKKENETLYDTLKSQGDITTLDNSIRPRAYQINQTFGTDAEKNTVSESTLYKSLSNTATTNPDRGNTANNSNNSGSTPGQQAEAQKDIKTESGNTRNEFSRTLKYPITLNADHQDVIKFNMIKYEPRKIQTNTENLNPINARRRITEQIIIGTVTLPVPAGISDVNSVDWKGDEFNPLAALGVDVVSTFIKSGGGASAEVAGRAIQSGSNNSGNLQSYFTSKFTEAATGTSNLLSRTQGVITNPNLELLFSSPTLRPFDFTFKLSARSSTEAKAIRSIIRFFKQGMSPIRTQGNFFLKAPHTFQLEYLHRKTSHSFLNKFKECALTSFSVDYTPEGQYATFEDGAMVSYQIRMQFQELEPIFNDDYGNPENKEDTEIGF